MNHAGELPVHRLLLGAVLLCAALGPPTAQAQEQPADGILSPRLAELSRPAVSADSAARQARAVGLPVEGPGSLQRRGRRVLAEVRFAGGAMAQLDALRAAGAQVLGASRRYQTVTVAAKPGELSRLDGLTGAESAREVLAPAVAAAPCAGAVISEGDAQLNAPSARSDFGLDGSGVTVGVLSDSFATAEGTATTAAGDVLSGDLPGTGNPCGNTTPVDVLSDFAPLSGFEPEASDEGRGMAQIVHDLAPGAAIDFATAEGGEVAFAKHIKELAAAGAEVIVDDVTYFNEPFFQDGPVAVAIGEVVAGGVTYLSAAGNDNLEDAEGNQIASWETPEFRDSAGCPAKLEALAAHPEHCLDFDPKAGQEDDTFGITVEGKQTLEIDVQWAEPWFDVQSDIDAYLLDSEGNPLVVEEGSGNNIASQVPAEQITWENPSPSPVEVQLAIDRCFSPEPEKSEEKGCNYQASESTHPRIKVLLAENGEGVSETEYPKSSEGDVVGPTVYGHSGSPDVIAVGAERFDNDTAPEPYSSRGPVTHYFGPVSGTAPAAALIPPQTLSKPDLVASDCGRTTFFVPSKTPGVYRFCGTSAAAPHAAGVVALAKQADPAVSPAQIRVGLAATARPVGAFGPEAVGAGLIDAYGAVDEIALPPRVTFAEPSLLTKSRSPQIAFAANRPVTFTCSLDGAPPARCESPFTPPAPLGDGQHTLAVAALDLSGRRGSAENHFTVDTVAPRTFIAAHPHKNVRIHGRRARLTFRFRSDDPAATFICKIDGGLFHFCPAVLARRFAAGRHVVRVKALDAAGNVDPTAAVFRFQIRRVG